jgi:transcriptional regulator with GAF, ATPase, and Fis domain
MKIDENEFFREATLRICSHLEIEEGLKDCFDYISRYMPADAIYLEKNEPMLSGMRVMARADAESCETMDVLVPYTKEARDAMTGMAAIWLQGELPPVLVINDPEEPVTRCMTEGLGESPSSAMSLPLVIENKIVGALAIIAEGSNRFNEHHSHLYSLLKEPFFIAMSNNLKHRNELKLFDREFFWEVTMRICGSLEIEKGLYACFQYIRQHIPVDTLYLERVESEFSGNRVIARANTEKGESLDILIPFSKQAIEEAEEIIQGIRESTTTPVLVYNESDKNQIAKYMLDYLGEPPSSIMGCPLVLEGQMVGALTALAEGDNRFEEEHVKLFSTLRIPFFIAMSNALKHQEILQLKNLLQDDNRYLQQELQHQAGDNIVGSNFGLKGPIEMVRQVADLDSPVLLLGETGTGKDLIANAIHYSSSRRDEPFISVNCGAIPESLIDSELFGHEKGAFTGALSEKRGRFERAHKGTIFLDEVGELPLQAQVRLLRVLQNKEIERVGGTKTISLDLRVITATNRDLAEMVKNNQFREDLWFRLNVFPITLPPLRERRTDIPALLQHFITKKTRELKLTSVPELEPGSIEILMEYSWPGNVRELENVVERALILNRTGPLSFRHLQQGEKEIPVATPSHSFGSDLTLDDVIIQHIRSVLAKTNGKIHGPGGAAEILGINASTLRNRMKKLGIT